MSRNGGIRITALLAVAALAAPAAARAAEDPEPPKLRFGITLAARPAKNHFRDAVQKSPDFALVDGTRTIRPGRAGFIYRVEQSDGNRLLLAMPSQGLYGWAPRDSVVLHNEAEAYFTNELETRPPTSFAYLMRAIISSDDDRALRDLDAALRLDPRNVAALIERSFLHATRKRMDLALEDVDRALRVDPQCAEALVERGVYHYRLGENQAALTDLDRARELGSRSISIPMVRGAIHVERRQVDDAVKAFQEAIEIDPKSYDARLMLGSAFLLKAQYPMAIAAFDRAIQIEPEKGDGYGGRAVARLSLGHRKEALNDLNQAIRFNAMRADLFRDRGQVYAMDGHWQQALADLDTAIRIDPNDVESHVSRAWTLATCPDAKLRDGKKAVDSATRACELTRWKSPRPLSTLAAAFAEAGNFAGAVQMQVKAIEATPEKDPVLRYYTACLERYRAGRPWHRVGLLQGMGLRRRQPPAAPAKADAQVEQAGGPRGY